MGGFEDEAFGVGAFTPDAAFYDGGVGYVGFVLEYVVFLGEDLQLEDAAASLEPFECLQRLALDDDVFHLVGTILIINPQPTKLNLIDKLQLRVNNRVHNPPRLLRQRHILLLLIPPNPHTLHKARTDTPPFQMRHRPPNLLFTPHRIHLNRILQIPTQSLD